MGDASAHGIGELFRDMLAKSGEENTVDKRETSDNLSVTEDVRDLLQRIKTQMVTNEPKMNDRHPEEQRDEELVMNKVSKLALIAGGEGPRGDENIQDEARNVKSNKNQQQSKDKVIPVEELLKLFEKSSGIIAWDDTDDAVIKGFISRKGNVNAFRMEIHDLHTPSFIADYMWDLAECALKDQNG